MNINGINGSGPVVGPHASEGRARRPSSIPPAPDSPAAKTHISGPGQLFSQLAQLSHSDPAKFKEVAQSIADQFKSAAENSSGRESAIAQKFAERFGQAAQTGDLSAFRAEGGIGHHHHHHHHHHGGFGNDEVRSVLQNALDLVHEAQSSSSSGAATTAPDSSNVPSSGDPAPSESDATPAAMLAEQS
jgi:hypothetical protein